MQATSIFVIAAGFMLAASVVPSSAQNHSDGSEPAGGESARGATAGALPDPAARALPAIPGQRSESRAPNLDPEARKRAYTLVGRSRDGGEVSIEPGEGVIRALEDEESGSLAPDSADEESDRAVIGADNRVRVADSRVFPFSTVGYLQIKDGAGQDWRCTATLIGPRTLLTAARCLYSHGDGGGGWLDDFIFWPGLNGGQDVPFGSYEYEVAYVFSAFIHEYDGSLDSVWAYDYGIVELAQAPGDETGWLGFRHADGLGNFDGNLVGYHNDVPDGLAMLRSSCHVPVEDVAELYFYHSCDSSPGLGSAGAPIYVLDRASGRRHVVGMHIADDGNQNWALRLHRPVVQWMLTFVE